MYQLGNEYIYESENMDFEEASEMDNWEMERQLLQQQVKDLDSALNKSKKFHQKFVDDVVHSEEVRNQEFEREKREMIGVNKQQAAQIRELTKEKIFYETTCAALMQEADMRPPEIQPAEKQKSLPPSNRLTRRNTGKTKSKTAVNDSNFKISTKLFHDNKKLKEKVSKLTKLNADLRRQVKQLENFKSKTETKKQRQVGF